MLIRYFIILSMIRILFKSISIIPWPILKFLSWVLGHLAVLLNVSAYKVTKKNLIYCGFNDEKLIKQSFLCTMELLFEYPYIWGNPNNYKKLVENPEDIVQDENPKIFMTMHMGCVDVMLFLISEKNKGINILYTPAKNKNIEKATKESRSEKGAKLIPANMSGIKSLLSKFNQKEDFVIAPDLVPHTNKETYSYFFNQECLTVDIIEKLSHRESHNLYFVYFTKGKNKKYKLNCKKISQKINMLEMNQLFEHAIKESIPLYGWEYKKFRKLRGKQKNIY